MPVCGVCCIEGTDIEAELDKRALAKINLPIKVTALAETNKAKTAKEAWLSLQRTYKDMGVVRRIGLYLSLFHTKYDEFSLYMKSKSLLENC